MFDTFEDEFPWIFFAIQQIGVPIGCMCVPTLFVLMVPKFLPRSGLLSTLAGAVLYLSPVAVGFIGGKLAVSFGLAFARAGKWIWVIPSILWSILFVGTAAVNWRDSIPAFFGVRGGDTEEGIGAILITLPTFSCLLYSWAISGQRWPRRK